MGNMINNSNINNNNNHYIKEITTRVVLNKGLISKKEKVVFLRIKDEYNQRINFSKVYNINQKEKKKKIKKTGRAKEMKENKKRRKKIKYSGLSLRDCICINKIDRKDR